jgi:hypothetical protein
MSTSVLFSTLSAMSGGRKDARVDCESVSPDAYLADEFAVKSAAGLAYDERAPHLARLVLDCDERTATLSDAVNLVLLLQCALRSAFAGFGRLDALITTSMRGGFHLHFHDVVFAVQPTQRCEKQNLPLVVCQLLRWVRCVACVMFAPLPADFVAAARAEPRRLRVDVDQDPLDNGVRCRIFGTQRTDVVDVEPADTEHRVVAVVVDNGTVHKVPGDAGVGQVPWWQRLLSVPLSLASLSVRPDSAQVARFMRDPVANNVRMVRGSAFFAFRSAPTHALDTFMPELAQLFFPTHEQPWQLADQVELTYVNSNMAVAVCRREPGDGLDCVACRRRRTPCRGTRLFSLLRWHNRGGSARAGDIWHHCDASPGAVESITALDRRVNIDEWRVRIAQPPAPLPFGSSAPPPPLPHLMSLPLSFAVYERGLELGAGVRTHDAAAVDAQFSFAMLARAMATAEGVLLSDNEAALMRTLPTVEHSLEYTPSPDDPDELLKPSSSATSCSTTRWH